MKALACPELILTVADVHRDIFVLRIREQIGSLETGGKLSLAINGDQSLIEGHLDEAPTVFVDLGA